jgi:hypothetical protein
VRAPEEPRRLLEGEGEATTVLRAYARRTSPAEVERWLVRPAPRTLRPTAALAGGLIALLGIWLVSPAGVALDPGSGGGVGGAEGTSGIGLGTGGGRGSSGSPPPGSEPSAG